MEKKRPSTKFSIRPELLDATIERPSEEDITYRVREVVLSRTSTKGVRYYDREDRELKDLSNTSQVELRYVDDDEIKPIELPQNMLDRLSEYLIQENLLSGREANIPFDCASFAHCLNNVPYEFGQFDSRKWDFHDFDEASLSPGDTVLMYQNLTYGHDLKHLAIYLGEGFYLSKSGSLGKLIVSNIENMEKAFESDSVVMITPKSTDSP